MLLFVIASISMAYTTGDAKISKGLKPGDLAPEIHLQQLSLVGKYSFVQFWAAYDATSRVNNVLMSNKFAKLNRDNFQMISISFDEKQSVFEETIRTDNLDLSSQFNIPTGKKSEIFQDYRLNEGFRNLLIDPHGVIIAVDLSPVVLRNVFTFM